MNQRNEKIVNRFDTPIPKPPDEILERFIRSTEARFTTKRKTRETAAGEQRRAERSITR